MRRHQQVVIGLSVVIAACAAIATCSLLFGPIFRHRTEIPAARSVTRIARTISAIDVKDILIDLDGRKTLILTAPKDAVAIERLINSLKRVTVADRECRLTTTDRLVVHGKKPGSGVNFWGHFDPDNAPVISKSMRSDDLSAIIYDIFKRKGMKTRSG